MEADEYTNRGTWKERLSLLTDFGVSEGTAARLAEEYPHDRIVQAIEYCRVSCKHDSAEWLKRCLEDDWLPFLLFKVKPPASRDDQGRIQNLRYAGKVEYIKEVDRCVQSLTYWDWNFLAHRAIRRTDDECYRRRIFANPTRSNWYLCERVHSLCKRDALASPEYREMFLGLLREGRNPSTSYAPLAEEAKKSLAHA